MRKVISRFAAAGSDGRPYSVEIVRDYTDALPGQETDLGTSELVTSNGDRVTRVRRGLYKVNGTGVELTSSVPTAPCHRRAGARPGRLPPALSPRPLMARQPLARRVPLEVRRA